MNGYFVLGLFIIFCLIGIVLHYKIKLPPKVEKRLVNIGFAFFVVLAIVIINVDNIVIKYGLIALSGFVTGVTAVRKKMAE